MSRQTFTQTVKAYFQRLADLAWHKDRRANEASMAGENYWL